MIYLYNLVRTNNHPIFGHALFGNGVLLPLSNDSMLIQKEKLNLNWFRREHLPKGSGLEGQAFQHFSRPAL